jgi:hypothetical protein
MTYTVKGECRPNKKILYISTKFEKKVHLVYTGQESDFYSAFPNMVLKTIE